MMNTVTMRFALKQKKNKMKIFKLAKNVFIF